MSQLRKDAFELYKKTWLESWLIGILSGLLIAGLFALNMLVSSVWLFITPLLVLPIFFAAIMSHLGLRHKRQLTLGITLKEMALFYRPPFNSSFSYIGSFFKSFAIFVGFLFIGVSLGYYFTYLINPGIVDSFAELDKIMKGATTVTDETINYLLSINNYAIFTYLFIALLPASFFQALVLFYFITRNATGVYFRNSVRSDNPQLIKMVQNHVYMRFRMKMFKKYMSLNWPLILLFVLGYGVVLAFTVMYSKNIMFIVGSSLTGGMALMSLYLPFYLNNMEAIYLHSGEEYTTALDFVTKAVMSRMEYNLKVQEEQKKKFEETFAKKDGRIIDEEDKEKDPPSES